MLDLLTVYGVEYFLQQREEIIETPARSFTQYNRCGGHEDSGLQAAACAKVVKEVFSGFSFPIL